jgi:hypothetical protein
LSDAALITVAILACDVGSSFAAECDERPNFDAIIFLLRHKLTNALLYG